MDEVIKIVNDIKAGNIKPIYFLMGEEPYYIDKLAEYIEKNILSEEEKGFNQTVLYGRDVSVDDVISAAKRYPMMADRQVIIVKEAQDLSRTIDKKPESSKISKRYARKICLIRSMKSNRSTEFCLCSKSAVKN